MSEGEAPHSKPRWRLAFAWVGRRLAWIADRERVTIIFAGGLLLVAYLQWRTLEKTDLTLKAEQRPWIQFDVPAKAGLSWAGTEISGLMTFRLINTGHSPALNVRAFSNTLLVWDDERARKLQDLLCEAFHSGTEEGYGATIFPNNSPYERFVTIDIMADEIERFKTNPPTFLGPLVVGCVTYFYNADHSVHDTGFMYMIRLKPPRRFVLPKPGEVIPPEKYDLVPWGSTRIN
jgi:hypothetical protein